MALNFSESTRAVLFWIFTILALVVDVASMASTSDTAWATQSLNGGVGKYGLWTIFGCASSGTSCVSASWPSGTKCYGVGVGTGFILIFTVLTISLCILFRMYMACSSQTWQQVKWCKNLIRIKALIGLVGPAFAVGFWTNQCYNKELKQAGAVWSVGPGILILSMIFEVLSLYGVVQALPEKPNNVEQN
eukprot:TRINITY_DN3451_c0_g1_i1.p1 TRINITY_DN3451_c0_g1~~TRINITY_DN3451_c0_g1_i1.p1  ORF type:complete len:190 (+),score=40.88 TRINITY_DN3451_c0_g1_i1:124-693(+)